MNLIEIIADVLANPEGAFERLESMGVQQQVIDHVLPLRDTASIVIEDENHVVVLTEKGS